MPGAELVDLLEAALAKRHAVTDLLGGDPALVADPPPAERWQVRREGKVLAFGFTEFQAVDRAIFAWGKRRRR